MTMLDCVTSTLYAHGVTYLDNIEMRWGHHCEVEQMEDDEKWKYDNYKRLETAQQRQDYGPKQTKYTSGKGMKREFGEAIWSRSGHDSFHRIERMYKEAIKATDTWAWMLTGWNKYSAENELFCHYRRNDRMRGDGVEN